MRGNLPCWAWRCFWSRSIPAHAGQPFHQQFEFLAYAVYPRACGATQSRIITDIRIYGLSPRMRGNHELPRREAQKAGSIPAHAGQPIAYTINNVAPTVYPRACGATLCVGPGITTERGLSPRMRGNHILADEIDNIAWSIPAHAGQPTSLDSIISPFPVYPRACGATVDGVFAVRADQGLSPRMRGNPVSAR